MSADNVIPAVRFSDITKRFPGTVALQGVSVAVRPGDCHAIMGENGAGKSTLGKILAGIYRPDEGHVEVHGISQQFHSPLDAQRAGVAIVHQEFSFCPNLSVAENICLSRMPTHAGRLDWNELGRRATAYLAEVGAGCDVWAELSGLSPGQTQLVQVAAALATGASIFVMDEPTSSLSAVETARIEELVARLRRRGATILYVSHRMDEIFRLCNVVSVMRDGRHVATMPVAQTHEDELVELMIGRTGRDLYPEPVECAAGPERLRLKNFTSPGKFQDVSFAIRAGEILGVAGLVGSGRTEIALGIFGLDPHVSGGVWVDGRAANPRSPREAMDWGLGLVSEDRKGQGLVLGMGCGENITLASLDRLSRCGVIQRDRERGLVADLFGKLRVKAAWPDSPAQTLSGGNQQKLVLGKWIARRSAVLILDEPTRGVDIGAKAEIHRLIAELAAAGHAILMISSELPEVLHLSTRVVVMRNGRLAGQLERSEFTAPGVLRLMTGCAEEASTVRRLP